MAVAVRSVPPALQSSVLVMLTFIAAVINGCISMPIAILAFFFLPDTPGTAKANWVFTERVSFRILAAQKRAQETLTYMPHLGN